MRRQWGILLSAGLCGVLTTASLVAAEPEAKRPDRAGKMAHGKNEKLAAMLAVGNHTEVQLAKFVAERTKNSEVKEFANQMINDHGKMLEKLQGISGAAKSGNAEKSEADGGVSVSLGKGGLNVDVEGDDRGDRQLNVVALKRELGQECLKSAKAMLEKKQGADFDKCYVGMQVAAHMQMLDTLKVFGRHASGDLASVIKEGTPVVEGHLDHAIDLMEKWDKKGTSAAAN